MYPNLFSPIEIGTRQIKNRICVSAHADSLAIDGMPTDRTLRYYELKAVGGAGFMMCFGSASVHPTSPAKDWNGVELFDDKVIPHLEAFSTAMHRHGVPVVSQITHRGRRGRTLDTFERLYSPSTIREPNHRETPHALDKETISLFVKSYADAALRLKRGGFDGCEVMASHGHLIDQFWSFNSNERTDEYGGSLENRLRFGIDVLSAIREKVGNDFIIGIRMTGDDFIERGLESSLCQEIAGYLDGLKIIDYFNIIGGTAETYFGEAAAVPDMSFPLAVYSPLSALIRNVVKAPVIATGRINDVAVAEKVLADGHADLCIMNRALIADPDFPNKAKDGKLDDIRQCMGYNQGCIDRIYTGKGVTCVQNAVIGREKEWAELPRSAHTKNVLVIGGGPAGLECARVARLRGHDVTLLEKNSELGGQTLIANRGPSRTDFDGACRFMALQCKKLGVKIETGIEATSELVLSKKPDVVVVATGARAFVPKISGLSDFALSAWDVLTGTQVPHGKLLVVDEEYGHQALSTAEYLLDEGRDVTLVTSERTIGSLLGVTTIPPLLQRLYSKNIRMFFSLRLESIAPPSAIFRNVWSEQEEIIEPFDGFVFAYGGVARSELFDSLKGKLPQVELIGDAFAPRTLQHAILEGHRLAREL